MTVGIAGEECTQDHHVQGSLQHFSILTIFVSHVVLTLEVLSEHTIHPQNFEGKQHRWTCGCGRMKMAGTDTCERPRFGYDFLQRENPGLKSETWATHLNSGVYSTSSSVSLCHWAGVREPGTTSTGMCGAGCCAGGRMESCANLVPGEPAAGPG